MSATAFAPRASSIALPAVLGELPERPPTGLLDWLVSAMYWPMELVRLVALIYLLPLVIYVVISPIALVIAAAHFLLGGSSSGF